MIKIWFSRLASIFSKRKISIDNEVPLLYLAEILLGHLFSVIRSFKLLGASKIPIGRVLIGKGVVVRCRSKVSMGSGCKIGEFVHIDGFSIKGVSIGSGASIGSFSRIIGSGSIASRGEGVSIGNRVGIGEYSRIGGSGGVLIGDDTIIAQYFSAHPENHNFLDKSKLIREQGTTRNEIVIGTNCWIGAKVTVTAGVHIGEGAVIGSGSVVTMDIPPFCVAAGVPAKILRDY